MMVQGRTHRMTEMVARLAPGATRASRRGPRSPRSTRRMQSESQGRVRSRVALSRRRHPVQGSARRTRAADALAAHGRRGVRHDHLGRQRRQPHAHARRAPGARAGGARGARRGRGAAAAAAAGRESRADAHGRGARRGHRDRRRQAAHLARRAVLAARQRDPPRRRGARLHARAVGRARAAALVRWRRCRRKARFASWISAGARRISGSAEEAATAARARRRADRGVRRAARRRRTAHPHDDPALRREHRPPDRGGAHDGGAAPQLRRNGDSPRHDVDAKAALRADAARDRRRSPASSRSASAPPCRSGAAQIQLRGQGGGQAARRRRGRCRAPSFAPPTREYFRAAGIPLLKGRAFAATDRRGLGQGRDHQPDARRQVLPRRGPDREAHRVDRRRAAIHAVQRRLAHRSSVSSAIRRTAGWTRRRDRWCSCRSRRSWRSAAAW